MNMIFEKNRGTVGHLGQFAKPFVFSSCFSPLSQRGTV
jgi:hypothetical protein